MADKEDLIDTILDIVRGDVARIKKSAKERQLDKLEADNLVSYAGLQIKIEAHQLKLEEAAENQKMNAEQYAELKQAAAALIKKGQ